MSQKGQSSAWFFLLARRSAVVVGLAICIAFAANRVKLELPQLRDIGGIIGASVSGTFLWVIGILNLLILRDVLKVWHKAKAAMIIAI